MVSSKESTILIAEDEPEIRQLLTYALELEQFKVHQAADGQEAIETFKAHADEIVLLITDLGLPKVGGLDLIVRLKKLKPTLKVIAATAYGTNAVRDEVTRAGADEFLPKPFVIADLVQVVMRLLERTDITSKK